MVLASVERASGDLAGMLNDRDLGGVAAVALANGGGLVAAQEVTDQVLPMLGMSADPSSPSGLGISALVKMVGAALTVALAMRFGGGAVSGLGFGLASGMVASSGLDLIDVVQRGGLPGRAPTLSSPTSGKSSSTSKKTSSCSSCGGGSRSASSSPKRRSSSTRASASVGGYR